MVIMSASSEVLQKACYINTLTFTFMVMANSRPKFAVCLSVCVRLGRIADETAEQIWLKFCTESDM